MTDNGQSIMINEFLISYKLHVSACKIIDKNGKIRKKKIHPFKSLIGNLGQLPKQSTFVLKYIKLRL